MRHVALLFLAVLSMLVTGCMCGDPAYHDDYYDPPVTPAACSTTGATALTLGTGDSSFQPLNDGMSVSLTYGAQGGTMLGLRHRVSGDGLGSCASHTTVVEDDLGRTLATETVSLSLVGGQSAGTTYLIFTGPAPLAGSPVHVRSAVAGMTTEVTVFIQ